MSGEEKIVRNHMDFRDLFRRMMDRNMGGISLYDKNE